MKKQGYRHGEIMFVKIEKLPEGLKEAKTKIIMKGSHGHDHSFDNGKFYPHVNGKLFGFFEAKDTSLIHPEHSPYIGDAVIPDGSHQIIKQYEHTPNGLVQVID